MIDVKNIGFAYADVKIFNDLSFSLSDNSITAILGLNGEGKTTLIKLLLGLLKPEQGSIFVDDIDINKTDYLNRSKLLSYVPQDQEDSLELNVTDFICMGSINRQSIFSGPDADDRNKALGILKELNCEELIQRNMPTLSSGQRRLIYLARAIYQDSKIIIMDEPVNSLDYIKQHHFLSWLKDYSTKNNKQIVMSIHNPVLAYDYADSFLFFKEHKLYSLINKKDSDFYTELCKNIEVLYDNKVNIEIKDDHLYLNYISDK